MEKVTFCKTNAGNGFKIVVNNTFQRRKGVTTLLFNQFFFILFLWRPQHIVYYF